MQPRIFNHQYHQSLVYKVMNACKPDHVYQTFEQTLDIIRRTHHLTRGVKQIVYLTGWQYDGHDSKYPAWFEVNPRLARPGEAPLDSLLWLVREAREKYNTVVSVHINMCDAYDNSPLWQDYVQAGCALQGMKRARLYVAASGMGNKPTTSARAENGILAWRSGVSTKSWTYCRLQKWNSAH
jgi:hypothetical protein